MEIEFVNNNTIGRLIILVPILLIVIVFSIRIKLYSPENTKKAVEVEEVTPKVIRNYSPTLKVLKINTGSEDKYYFTSPTSSQEIEYEDIKYLDKYKCSTKTPGKSL